MQLADWMEAEGLDDAALGARIGKSRVSVSRYRRGLETPSTEAIKNIVRESGGKVTADELLGIAQPEGAQ